MKLKLLTAAKSDVADAIAYYNTKKPGLGSEFAGEVRKAIERILQFPKAWVSVSANVRRCQINRFPYGVFYSLMGETVIVVAVLHGRREPRVWQARADE